MLIGIFYTLKLLDDLSRSLFSDSGNSGNIVGCISHQGLHIDEFFRRHSVSFHDVLGKVVFYYISPALSLWNADLHIFCGQLQKIPVSGNDPHLIALLFPDHRHRPEKVIRLIAFFHHQRYIHGF